MIRMPHRRPAYRLAQRHAQRGITLFEILVVMSIVAVLMAVGIPSFKYVTNANRISAEVNGLLGDMQFARSEAIKEGVPVSVCVSSDGLACLANDTNWNKGWIVFTDPNQNGVVDAGELVQRIQATFKGSDTFTATGPNVSFINFNREGFATGLANNGALFTLHAATATTGSTRCLSVTLIGIMTTEKYGTVDAAGNTCQ